MNTIKDDVLQVVGDELKSLRERIIANHEAAGQVASGRTRASIKVELTEEDLLIETAQTEGYVTESEGDTSVVLDTNLTPELIEEGFVREIISKIQTMRKEAGFEVMDKIRVSAKDNEHIMNIMKDHKEEIMSEVLADEMNLGETDGYVKEWNINKENVVFGVTRL